MTNSAFSGTKNEKKMDAKKPEKVIPPGKKLAGKDQKGMIIEPGCDDKNPRYKSLVIESTKYRTRYNRKFENRKRWINPDTRKILSYIPGTIVKVFVTEGQNVQDGDNILILEAMKMKNRLVFSKSGKVKRVYVSEGEKVPKNYLMVELE